MLISLKVKHIGTFKYKSKTFVLAILLIPGINQKGLEVYIYIKYKLYLVKSLKTNMLISNNVFYTKDFSINFANIFVHIPSYKVDINISAKHHF